MLKSRDPCKRKPKKQCGGSEMFTPDPGSEFFYPGSWIRILIFYLSRIQIRNTAEKFNF